MLFVLAIVGASLFGVIGVAEAQPIAVSPVPISMETLRSLAALPHSSADGQLRKESARSGDIEPSGGFRTEIEAIEESLSIPGTGITPVGDLKATRVMLSGLYELDGGAWRLRPYIAAGVGVIDVNQRLLGQEQTTMLADVQFKSGLKYNITQKLIGSLEWRWSHGSKPTFALAGVPTKFQLKRGGFLLGVNYKLQ
jgi:opacity protein-like surface antigen